MKSLDVHPLNNFEYLAADGNGKIQIFDTRLFKVRNNLCMCWCIFVLLERENMQL